MRVLTVRNVHRALPQGLQLLDEEGIRRNSRNGPVIMIPGGVTTVYTQPTERVIFWAQRDANPFFHLFEAMWMLDGREDVVPLVRYAKQMAQYSDDGSTFHGAYGYRWRQYQTGGYPEKFDQLEKIVSILRKNSDDRRCVLQMWDPGDDLGSSSKDVPCNLTVTFQRDAAGRLDMVVFNRSNDVIWGCYGANAVHFSVLQEYLASEIGCEVGTYTQVSVNWHAYVEQYEKLRELPRPSTYSNKAPGGLYGSGHVRVIPMTGVTRADIRELLREADEDGRSLRCWEHPWLQAVAIVLHAHERWRTRPAPDRFREAFDILSKNDDLVDSDWLTAGREWIQRRWDAWQKKQGIV